MTQHEPSYGEAVLESMVRELKWTLRWAIEEPEFLPPVYDEDTGEVAPELNNRAMIRASNLARKIWNYPGGQALFKRNGWRFEAFDLTPAEILAHISS